MKKENSSKKAQSGVFGMPFSVLFSIFLIIFFIATAFIAIRFFLRFQSDSQIGFFLSDLQDEIDDAWEAQSSSKSYDGFLPTKVTHICFINITSDLYLADAVEQDVYEEVQFSGMLVNEINFVLWPLNKMGSIRSAQIDHIVLPEENPYCIETENQKASVKIQKNMDEALVRVS